MPEPGIKLGISRIVVRAKVTGRRVVFADIDGKLYRAESIIVKRARRKGWRAFRLPPSIWSRLQSVEPRRWPRPDEALNDFAERIRALLPVVEGRQQKPRALAAVLWALSRCRRHREILDRLVERHRNIDPAHPGVPDIFLFRIDATGRPIAVSFAEVKRTGERLAPHQLDEIQFLGREKGIRVGVVRLLERRRYPRESAVEQRPR